MTTLAALQSVVAQGESETLELKRSTAELKRCGETLCAFLNGEGGKVLIGVAPDGKLVGQDVADITLREIAAMLGRFEPPARVEMSRVDVENGRQVIVLEAVPSRQFAPFVFESRPYKRVGSTPTVMSQEEYARLLLDRNHSRHRWENQPAVGVRLEDLDREEILRTRATAIEQRRLSAGTSMDVSDILDRLGLRIDGQVTQAAQMLYGTKFLPDYPQALLKLGRFRGTKITGDILDNKQEHLHAFAMVREAVAWLDRTLPLSARFPKGAINREDRLPVPAEALREIVINAVIHRDLSNPSSYVAIAVFDDRIEIHSIGDFPTGMRAELLTQEHRSIPRNPLIAGAFHRTGAIEVWGRGTNRVIEACRAYGIAEPTFTEGSGAVTVTFKAEVVAGAGDLVPRGHQVGTKLGLGRDQVQVLGLAGEPATLPELMVPSGRTNRTKFQFLADVRGMKHRNLAVELLRKLLNDEVKARSKHNLVQARSFADLLEKSVRRYQNRAIEAAQVIEELIELAKEMRAAQKRGEELGLTSDELAFYDALEVSDTAVKVLGDETLRTIARELVDTVKQNVTIDWTVKESVRAKLRVIVKRILRKYGYPPDKQEAATNTVLQQAELLSDFWTMGVRG